MTINHKKWMKYAILEALRSKGSTGKNPPVGCVIVKNGNMISSGRTSFLGRPHAEENAINKVKNKIDLIGSTIYLTLEPCAHKNNSGFSCAELICTTGISEAFVSCIDLDSRTYNKGIETLKNNNIKVTENFMKNESLFLYDGFFSRLINKKPYVTLKIACSLDGKIALKNNKSKWITNKLSRKYVHLIRSQNDAILTSSSTIVFDNPEMNCRLKGLECRSPIRVVIDRHLKVSNKYKIYNESPFSNIVLFTQSNIDNNLKYKKNISKVKIENKINNKDYFNFIFKDLANRGINNLLIECGSKLNTILLSLNLVDQLLIFRSGNIVGNDGIPFINELNSLQMKDLKNYKISSIRNFEDDILETRKLFN
ncbi:bifunctional diaminohydroxyphosphoribosylaminopyrimidine deaminase/5-amino-6-(5-phosphoribosylamino)uracil reductase RibD [Alphaproteobacteria bacterium]|nr:bifunctional diaminohydroxyphosphoribosylaminopyrimidine deaminase/5-amino-6-(5-phosphoribosylamino)uracil reductase RibD [Alphaproteobacteria bacterium]